MNHRISGFSLLEVLLAVVVITIAGLGAYSLFDTGVKSSNLTDAEDQAVQIANVYTDLASSNLTTNVATDGIVTLLQNSSRLSNKYFSGSPVKMYNAFGALDYSVATPTPYSYAVKIPLGCIKDSTTSSSSVPGQFFSKVNDMYSCDDDGSKDYSVCAAAITACATGTPTYLTLYFDMNT